MTSTPYDSLVTIGISTFLRKYTDEKVKLYGIMIQKSYLLLDSIEQ